QPFFVPVSARVSRRQSSSVVRGSRRNCWSLPLMRRVTGTVPSTAGASVPAAAALSSAATLPACAGTYAAMTPAATVLPVVNRNCRRVGFGKSGDKSHFGIYISFVSAKLTIATRDYVSRSLPRISGQRVSKSLSRWSPRCNTFWTRCCVSGHISAVSKRSDGGEEPVGGRQRDMVDEILRGGDGTPVEG